MDAPKNNLQLKSLVAAKKRVARGRSGKGGKTAGRGTKGAGSRAGKPTPAAFEGGQTPLIRRLPKKKGFRPKVKFLRFVFNLEQIAKVFKQGEIVSPQSLIKKGLIGVPKTKGRLKLSVKILGGGDKPTKSFKFKNCLFSKKAASLLGQ